MGLTSLFGALKSRIVDGTHVLSVDIMEGGGGASFEGQLVQDGNDVSTVNPLPVSVQGAVEIANDSGNSIPCVPLMSSAGHLSATTAATGTNWTAFSSQVCKQLTLSNQSGTTIEVRQGAAGVGFQIPTGAFYTFFGISNANTLDVRRVDTSNTQVTVTARWES